MACAFDRGGTHAAFALGDGTVRLVEAASPEAWTTIEAHDGGVLALAADTGGAGFVTGGDDGKFVRIGAGGAITEIAGFGSRWVEHVASFADQKASLLACSAGKAVHLYDASGVRLKTFEHPSTVTGIAFDARGKRLAASHYNGASLWFTNATSPTPRFLEWKGSHTGVALHPAGEALVTAMQENALHGWRLPAGDHMRMSGYPSKTESDRLHQERPLAREFRSRLDRVVAILRWWANRQAAGRTCPDRGSHRHAYRLPSADRNGGCRLQGWHGGSGGYRQQASASSCSNGGC